VLTSGGDFFLLTLYMVWQLSEL